MFKRIIITLLILITSSYAVDDLQYHSDKQNTLSTLLSYKDSQLDDNLYLNLDLSSMLVLVDDGFELDTPSYALKTTNPDQVFVTLTYKF